MSRIESKGLFCQNQPLKHGQNHGDPWYGVILLDYESSPFFLRDSKSEQNASARENHPTRERRDAAVREKNEGLLTKPEFLTFHSRLILECEVYFSNQLSASNGVPSLIELLLPLPHR